MSSSSSVYWNIHQLAWKAAGDGVEGGSTAVLHRRLRSLAYCILLDTGEELYRDVSEVDRPVVNEEIAAAVLLRLRAEGRHGTAARLSWRLDELADLQQQLQVGSGDCIARLVSFLLHIRGSANSSNAPCRTTVSEVGALGTLKAQRLPAVSGVQPDSFTCKSSVHAAFGSFDGIPVGRRLRLQRPPGSLDPPLVLPQPAPVIPAASARFVASAAATAVQPSSAGAAADAGSEEASVSPRKSFVARTQAVDVTTTATADGWFPFRDAAGLPLAPRLDAPLDSLLGLALGQGWGHGTEASGFTAGNRLVLVAAGFPPSPSLAHQSPLAAAAADATGALPLLLGSLPAGLVHTRFGHINPILLRMSGSTSECFSMRLGLAMAAGADASGERAAAVEEPVGLAGGIGDAVSSRFGPSRESVDFPAPYTLAALGVGFDRRSSAGGLLPPRSSLRQLKPPDVPSQPGSSFPLSAPADSAKHAASVERGHAKGGPGSGPAVPVKGQAAAFGVIGGVRSESEDEVLLYDMVVMALHGVASAQWMLWSGMVRSHCFRLASQRRLLSQICDTGELRLRLGNFVASYGTYGTASINGWAHQDEALAAFADAVRALLVMYDGDLQEMAASNRLGLKVGRKVQPSCSAASYGSVGKDAGGATCNVEGGCEAAAAGLGHGRRHTAGGGLLGLYLSLSPLRIHLQRLADVCMCVPDPAWIPPPGAAAARDRILGRRDGGGANSAYDGRMPPIAPSLWQVYGFPQGAELLDWLYRTLLQTDHAKTPLLRLLFAAAAAPYLRRVRAWLYDTVDSTAAAATACSGPGGTRAPTAAAVPSPPAAPSFAAPMQRLLAAAGLQMRLLQGLDAELGDVAGRIRKMAAFEAEEARLIAQQYNEALTAASPSSSSPFPAALSGGGGAVGPNDPAGGAAAMPDPVLGLLGGTGGALLTVQGIQAQSAGGGGNSAVDEFDYPLVFGLEALQQLAEAAAAAATARDAELSSLLEMLDRRRRAAAEAADVRSLVAAQEALAAEEASRAAKVAAAEQRRLARARLLAEQRQAMDERSARLRAERERRIAEEQALTAEAVLKEHNEAAAALAAELARLRASYGGASYSEASATSASALAAGFLAGDERAAEAAERLRRCEWREARMALAARRRLLWQGIEAEELKQLREVVTAARDAQAGGAVGPLQLQRPPAPPLLELLVKTSAAEADGLAPQRAALLGEKVAPPGEPDVAADSRAAAAATVVTRPGGPFSPSTPTTSHRSQPAAVSPEKATFQVGDVSSPFRTHESMPQARGPPTPRAGAGSPRDGAAGGHVSLSLLVTAPAGGQPISPHRFVSPRSPGSVLHRPRRRTYHDASPSAGLLSPRGLAMATPGLRGRNSDGGASISAASPAASRGGAVQVPRSATGHHGSARRSLSVTGAGAFLASPFAQAGAGAGLLTWPDGGGGLDEAGGRGAGTGRRLSSGGWAGERSSRPGSQPRAQALSSRPSSVVRGSSGRVAPGGGGFGGGPGGGGLLLQLQSRRRRWAVPEAGCGAAVGTGGFFGMGGGALAQPPPLPPHGPWGPRETAPAQRSDGACAIGDYRNEEDAQQQQQQRQEEGDGQIAEDALMTTTGEEASGGPQPHSSRADQRRRALWKLPPAYEGGGGKGAGPPFTKAPFGELPMAAPGIAGVASPTKALLWSYLQEARGSRQVLSDGSQQAKQQVPAAQGWGNPLAWGLDVSTPRPPVPDARREAGTGAVRDGGISEDLAYAPVGVAVQTCLYGSVLAHYRLTTRAVWHVLVHEYRLVQFCLALRRFFFCEAGDVAGALADSLIRRTETRPHVPPSTAELRAMLDEALQASSLLAPAHGGCRLPTGSSSAGADAAAAAAAAAGSGGRPVGAGVGGCETALVAQLLSVRSAPRRSLGTGSYFASDAMLVTCRVPAPLDAVISAACLASYSDIFSLLMRVRCAGAVLAACWARLDAASSPLVARELRAGKADDGGGCGGRVRGYRRDGSRGRGRDGGDGGGPAAVAGTGVHPLWLKRFTLARLWLQAASQVVALLMQHLQVELQGRCWAGLAASLQGSAPQDLIQMREAHSRYLDAAREVCMLPPAHFTSSDPSQPAAHRVGPGGGITSQPAAASSSSFAPGPRSDGSAHSRPHLAALGPPLMDILQAIHAMATVLRRALGALEVEVCSRPEVLSAAPRQPTVAPLLSSVSRPMQTGPGRDGDMGSEPGSDRAREGLADGGGAGRSMDLDEFWAHVVACETRLGRAMGGLHGAIRSRGEVGGLLGEVAAVLACDPCRAFTEGNRGDGGRMPRGA